MSVPSQNIEEGLQSEGLASKTPIKERPKSPRDLMLEELDAKIEEQREADDEYFYQSGDPRAIEMAAEMRKEAAGEGGPVDHNGRTLPPRDLETGQFKAEGEQEDEAEQAAAARVQPKGGVDPLEEFVVRQPGKAPMFKTVVDGKVQLIPLETARTQLQKSLAADERLRTADARQKSLDARERKLRQDEAEAVKRRALAPTAPVINEAELEAEATDLVRSLVSDPEPVAAKKLAKTLGKIRATAPQIDTNAIVRHAASVAKEEIAVENTNKALAEGFTKFQADYQDIVKDPDLYKLADAKTEAIALEHPEWSPEKVMSEAGKQVREWVAKISGKKPAPPKDPNVPSIRQLNKQKLTPMPQARSVRPVADDAEAPDDSPSAYLADVRKARGAA